MHDPTAKAVLIALADHANDDWTCWPSVTRLGLFTALSERTVQRALRRLTAEGLITLVARQNQSCLITLIADDSPVAATPLSPPACHRSPVTVTPTPVTLTPEPSGTPTEPPVEPSSPRTRGTTQESPHAVAAESRGSRLAADWQPSAAERRYAIERGLDPGLIAEEFRNYWLAVPGSRGRKLDWAATFRNRCLQRAGLHHQGARRENLARRGDGVVAAAERVLQRRGLGLA